MRLTDLPDDVLEDVFHAMRELICFPGEQPYVTGPLRRPQYSQDELPTQPVPQWASVLVLSHVCTHWRNLMLTRPRLWTFIRITGSFTNRTMVNEMLERSASFPLSILITRSSKERTTDANPRAVFDLLGVTSVISDYSERIHELGVVLRYDHTQLVLDSLAKCRVPRLEKLWLDNGQPGIERLPPAPLTIFDRMMPPLRVLHAHRIPFSWLPFEGLTRLELSCGPAPPLSALLHTLRHSPLLEILSLRIHIIPPRHTLPTADPNETTEEGADEDMEEVEPPAMLHHLRRLSLHAGPVYGSAFSVLPHIAFSPTQTATCLRFMGHFPREGACLYDNCPSLEMLAAGVERVAFVLSAGNLVSISSIDPVSLLSPVSFASEGVEGSRGGDLTLPPPRITVEYRTVFADMDDPDTLHERGIPLPCLGEGFTRVPFPSLTSLSMAILVEPDGRLQFSRDRFLRLLDTIPMLTSFSVDIHAAHAASLFSALGYHRQTEQGNVTVVCPLLDELVVTWLDEPKVDDFWSLERCCHARCAAGARIERLETSAFPEIVRNNLEHSVGRIVVASG